MFGKNAELYKAWQLDWERYKNIPRNLYFANLGTTCDANNFDYSLWNKSGFNFASAPQDMYYDDQILEQYGWHLKKGAYVFISVFELTFLVDKYVTDYHNFKYYGYLEPQRILNYSKRKAWMISRCPGMLDKRLFRQEIKSFIKRVLCIHKREKNETMEEKAKRTVLNWMHEFGWDDCVNISREQRDTIQRSWEIFLKEIEYCKTNELIPIVVVPPIGASLKKYLSNDIINNLFNDYIELICKLGIRMINFRDDIEFENDEYYYTPICLNDIGKRLFNRKLQRIVNEEFTTYESTY